MKTKPLLAIGLLTIVTSVTSCTILTSGHVPLSPAYTHEGAVYCLPIGKVTIIVERLVKDLPTKPDEKKAQPDKDKTSHAFGSEEPNAANEANAFAATPTAGTPAPELPNVPVNQPIVTPGKPTEASKEPKPSVPKNYSDYRISYTTTTLVPDMSRKFSLSYSPNKWFHDEITIQVGKDSLLDKVDISSEDRSPEIAKKLIELSTNVARSAAAFNGAPPSVTYETIFTATFDPTSTIELNRINNLLRNVDGGPYSVDTNCVSSPDFTAASSNYDPSEFCKEPIPDIDAPSTTVTELPGIVFRPALGYSLTLSRGGVAMEVASVVLPNEAEVLFLPVSRASFVKKVQNLDFTEGMLTQVTVNKPSEIEGAVTIPLEISRAILALPGQIVADNLAALESETAQYQKGLVAVQARNKLEAEAIEAEIQTIEQKVRLEQARESLRELNR
jgi:hypothetical protein